MTTQMINNFHENIYVHTLMNVRFETEANQEVGLGLILRLIKFHV